MCGPETCFPAESGFFSKLRSDRLTQIWLIIWIPLVVMWFVYFGFSASKAAHSHYESQGEFLFAKRDKPVLPVFVACNGLISFIDGNHSNCAYQGLNYTIHPYADNRCFLFKSMVLDHTAHNETISCTLAFKILNATLINTTFYSEIFVFDRQMMPYVNKNEFFDSNALRFVPSGRFMELAASGMHTDITYRRQVYAFDHHPHFYDLPVVAGYQLLAWDEYRAKPIPITPPTPPPANITPPTPPPANITPPDPTPIPPTVERKEAVEVTETERTARQQDLLVYGTFDLVAGDYVERTWKETKRGTGYDFWYFMGMLGGFSFLTLMLHSLVFMPFKSDVTAD